jgi:hypothetical protein
MSEARKKLNRSGQGNNLPEQIEEFKNLYILFKGDLQKMKWFYKNNTKADLVLMTYIYNLTNPYE